MDAELISQQVTLSGQLVCGFWASRRSAVLKFGHLNDVCIPARGVAASAFNAHVVCEMLSLVRDEKEVWRAGDVRRKSMESWRRAKEIER